MDLSRGADGAAKSMDLEEILLNALIAAIPVAIISKCLHRSMAAVKPRKKRDKDKDKDKDRDKNKERDTDLDKENILGQGTGAGSSPSTDYAKDLFDGSGRNHGYINAVIARITSSQAFRNPIKPIDTTLFIHQVAGHTSEPVRKLKSNILKPFNKAKLFWHEVSVYESMKDMGSHCSQSMKSFIPEYHGVVTLQIGNKLIPYIVLDDLTNGFKYPCCMDIKMGRQTFEPSAEETKKTRELKKYTYQSALGFRITGFKVYNVINKTYMAADKMFGRSLKPHQIQGGLSLFFNNGMYVRRDVILATISKLENILLWMKSQINLHLYCSSILVVYDGDVNFDYAAALTEDSPSGGGSNSDSFFPGSSADKVRVKLIDLAHVVPSDEGGAPEHHQSGSSSSSKRRADEGYLFGLTNLISYLHTIVKDIDNKIVYDFDSSTLVPL